MLDGVFNWFKETFSFVDTELLMMVGIVIFSIILIIVIFKVLYRFRVLKVLFAVIIFGGLLYMALTYVNSHKYLFSNESSFYVYGTTGFISTTVRTLELESNKSNLTNGGTGRIVVKVPLNTKIISSGIKSKEIKIEDIKSGDVVQVYCKESSLKNGDNEVTAVRIVRKYSN